MSIPLIATSVAAPEVLPPVIPSADALKRAEIKRVLNELDINDSNSILFFGSKAQKQLASVSDEMLDGVKNKDIGEQPKPDTGNDPVIVMPAQFDFTASNYFVHAGCWGERRRLSSIRVTVKKNHPNGPRQNSTLLGVSHERQHPAVVLMQQHLRAPPVVSLQSIQLLKALNSHPLYS